VMALQCQGVNANLRMASYTAVDPSFCWIIAPSSSNPANVEIQPYSMAGQACLDVAHGQCVGGTLVQTYKRNGTGAQQWMLI
jgi:hypothetical protein